MFQDGQARVRISRHDAKVQERLDCSEDTRARSEGGVNPRQRQTPATPAMVRTRKRQAEDAVNAVLIRLQEKQQQLLCVSLPSPFL